MKETGTFIEKLNNNDPQAQADLVKKFDSRLYLYFKLRIKGEDHYEDLVQEVFSSFFSGVQKKKIDFDHNIAPYIFGIAKRVLFNYFYKKKKETNIQKKVEDHFEFSYDFKEDKRLENEKTTGIINGLIDKLPDVDKVILREFYLKENKIEDIARLLGKTRHYISVRKDRALKKIKNEIFKQKDIYTA